MPLLNVPNETKVAVEAVAALHQTPPDRVISAAVGAYIESFPAGERDAVAALVRAAVAKRSSQPVSLSDAPPAAYEFSRLCFRRDIIESLGPNEPFRVVTPVGTFQMTKAQFYGSFPKVIESRSYRIDGIYHYPKVPQRAEKFRLS
jgi:hypothetical protein